MTLPTASAVINGTADLPADPLLDGDDTGIPSFLDRKKNPHLNRKPAADKLPVPAPIQARQPTAAEKLESTIKREADARFRAWRPTEADIKQTIIDHGKDAEPKRPSLKFFERQVREERAPSTLAAKPKTKQAKAARAVSATSPAADTVKESTMTTKTATKAKPAKAPKAAPAAKANPRRAVKSAARATTTRELTDAQAEKFLALASAEGGTEYAPIEKAIGWTPWAMLEAAAKAKGYKLKLERRGTKPALYRATKK